MSSYTKNEIIRVVSENNLSIKLIEKEEYDSIYLQLIAKYHKNNDRYGLWENLPDYVSYRNPDGWSFISDFVKDNVCILLLDVENDEFGVTLNNGDDLKLLLSESFRFIFYITDVHLDYLLCFNDHDCLIAWGKAKDWLLLVKALMDEV